MKALLRSAFITLLVFAGYAAMATDQINWMSNPAPVPQCPWPPSAK